MFTSLLLLIVLYATNAFQFELSPKLILKSKLFSSPGQFGQNNLNKDGSEEISQEPVKEKKSSVPQRNDLCRVFISGVVGADGKERYVNSHYVVNFPVSMLLLFVIEKK